MVIASTMTELEEKCREVLCRNCSRKPLEQVRSLKEIEQKIKEYDNDERVREALKWVLFKCDDI